jgi:iron-only hydrogenase group A
MVQCTIDGRTVKVAAGTSIMEAAREAGVIIPSLCHHEDIRSIGSCGMCVVEIAGERAPKRSCITPVADNTVVRTTSARLRRTRRSLLELVLAAHPQDCLHCIKHGKCELQDLAEQLEVRALRYDAYTRGLPVDRTSPSIVRDMNKCIGCGRCVTICNEVQTAGAIDFQGRGSETIVAPAGPGMGAGVCTNCGQCVVYCPVGALYENEDVERAWQAIEDPNTVVVAQIAPAVRVALGEEFGKAPGELVIGKIYAALKALGVDTVLDTNFSADLTIMEEGTEFLNRVANGGPLPLITSCSPGWIKFGETYFPELLENVSSCKSPQQMLGTLVKTVHASEMNVDPQRIVSLSVMPCTAKKYEAQRPEMKSSGHRDVDIVLTTRELARMIREAGIDFDRLTQVKPDPLLSEYSGAATIFGASGGVMEAALRTAYEVATGTQLERVEFTGVRGMEGVKEATVDLEGTPIRVAVASGLGNARELLTRVAAEKRDGNLPYHFIEIMACRGGCVGGGGQPLENTLAKRKQRSEGLYAEDAGLPVRRSHENQEVQALYRDHLGSPGSEQAHHWLHTHYHARSPFSGVTEVPVTHQEAPA